jgi:DNA processing protein
MNEILYQLWLCSLSNISTSKAHRLRKHFGSFSAVYDADMSEYEKVEGIGECSSLQIKNLDAARKILEDCDREGISIISYYGEGYPRLLKQINSPPVHLYVKGKLPPVDKVLTIAVVGARHSSVYGNACATKISYDLARAGAVIVSGMARGIDTAAHKGALKADGETIAVLGCGADICYPPENKEIKKIIESHGAVISELPPGSAPLGINFPARNRIISGLSVATVIVEGAATSGSVITARLSIEQGRETFCVPGCIDRKLSDGPHQLIRDGARLITGAKDIITDLAADYPELMVDVMLGDEARERITNRQAENLPPEQKAVLSALKNDFPTHIDEICHSTGIEAAMANQCLLMLEINGFITSLPGKQYVLRNK